LATKSIPLRLRHGSFAIVNQRIYLIGAGVISRHHAIARSRLPHPSDLYVADPSAAARETFQNEFPDAVVFDSSAAMLAHAPAQDLDIVCVATPVVFHHAEALRALRSGRHVVCEKPFVMDVAQAEELVSVAGATGLSVSCCSNRFLTWELNQKVADILRTGTLGEIYLMDWIHRDVCQRTGIEYQPGSTHFLDKRKNGGGTVMDWGPYDMSVLLRVLDPLEVKVGAAVCQHAEIPTELPEGAVFDVETQAACSMEFFRRDQSRMLVRYERTCATHGPAMKVVGIYGTRGYLEWDWLPWGENPRIRIRRTGAGGQVSTEEIAADDAESAGRWLTAPLHEFDRYLRGDRKAIVVANRDALATTAMLRAVYDASASGQAVSVKMA